MLTNVPKKTHFSRPFGICEQRLAGAVHRRFRYLRILLPNQSDQKNVSPVADSRLRTARTVFAAHAEIGMPSVSRSDRSTTP